MTYREAMAKARKEYLVRMLAASGGNVSETARATGMSRQHLTQWLNRFGIRGKRPNGHRGNWAAHGL